jgi:hypothetical protein
VRAGALRIAAQHFDRGLNRRVFSLSPIRLRSHKNSQPLVLVRADLLVRNSNADVPSAFFEEKASMTDCLKRSHRHSSHIAVPIPHTEPELGTRMRRQE